MIRHNSTFRIIAMAIVAAMFFTVCALFAFKDLGQPAQVGLCAVLALLVVALLVVLAFMMQAGALDVIFKTPSGLDLEVHQKSGALRQGQEGLE